MSMLAVLLATGETEKLRPLTEMMPSPMVPVVDRPVMAYAVELLARHGVKKIIVSLHQQANQIEAYFGNGQRWGVSLEYVLQRDPWGTAGALKWAQHLLSETFLVMPANAIIDVDVNAVLAQHRTRQSCATIVVHPHQQGEDPLFLDDNDCVIAAAKSTVKSTRVDNTGVYVFEPSVLQRIPERTQYDIARQLVPSLLKTETPMHGFYLHGFWNSLSSFEDHQLVQQVCLYSAQDNIGVPVKDMTIRFPSVAARQVQNGIWIGRNNNIHPSARLAPPIYIGKNCHIGREVELGPDTVIGANVIVDDGATIRQSTVMEGTHVGQFVNINNRFVDKKLLINVATEQTTYVLDDFLLNEVQSSIVNNSLRQGLDVLLALFLLILILPIMLLIALTLQLVNGQVFTSLSRIHSRHERQKLNREDGIAAFQLLRFKTRQTDGSYTFLGQTLERWELHRLPELWNVVRRDLVFVGVSPLKPDTVAKLTEPWQQKRYEYDAGFTGLWYTQTNRDSSLDEILIADSYYVATRTWRGDQRLLWQSPAAWYRRYSDC